MPSIQEIIHKFEVGEGSGYLQKLALILSLLALLVFYNVREYQGFATVEAMESAHLARQLSEGKGFTSLSLRPCSCARGDTERGGNSKHFRRCSAACRHGFAACLPFVPESLDADFTL